MLPVADAAVEIVSLPWRADTKTDMQSEIESKALGLETSTAPGGLFMLKQFKYI